MNTEQLKWTSHFFVGCSVAAGACVVWLANKHGGIGPAEEWVVKCVSEKRADAKKLIREGIMGVYEAQTDEDKVQVATSALMLGMDNWRSIDRHVAVIGWLKAAAVASCIFSLASAVAAEVAINSFGRTWLCEKALTASACLLFLYLAAASKFAYHLYKNHWGTKPS